jgi:hypothetical protein
MTAATMTRRWSAWLVLSLAALSGACGAIVETDQLPPGVRDPNDTRSPQGAVAAYNGVRVRFRGAFDQTVLEGALLTDEFGTNRYGQPVLEQPVNHDRRFLPDNFVGSQAYARLHAVRSQASQAIGLLTNFAPDAPPALRAHAYALSGYAEVLLADLYCSGVPLSTVDFDGDFTLQPGSSTTQVYEHALAQFDTALALAADSARILDFARVGRGRTLLALARYAEAGQAVTDVPDAFSYVTTYDAAGPHFFLSYFASSAISGVAPFDGATMTEREGRNGLDYLSSADPRVDSTRLSTNNWGFPIIMPAKYNRNGQGPMVVANGIEARLIEAEAALNAGDVATWLAKLNHLRQTAWTTIQPPVTQPLPDLTDPGTDEARLSVLFRERAFWLFLTGHRQGDLRRLARDYARGEEAVYPTGLFPDGQGVYGSDVTVPIPTAERELNPRFTGCIGREA